jgi:acetyl esterase/lipase
MARRRGRRLAGLLTALLIVSACSQVEAGITTTTATLPPTTSSSTTSSTTTTTIAPTTTTIPPTTTTVPDIGADVAIPEGTGPFPAVVLVHGGGWVAGGPSIMSSLAGYLTDSGFLTVNTSYKLANDSPGFPEALDDVACAVRYAAAHPDSDGTVALVGHSAGAHLSAVVALTGDRYGEDCPVPGTGLPDRLVGLAGPYDVNRLGLVMLPFFGVGPNGDPEAWAAGNPQALTDENTGLSSLIMYGGSDGLVDASFAIDFHEALVSSGSDSLLELVEGARHNQMRDPEWVGDLILVWLER